MSYSQAITILALSHLSNLIVAFYVNRAIKTKQPLRKPFSCELCLSFWIGLTYFSIKMLPIETIFIFASLTSLSAVLINKIVKW